ncbi:MAG: class I SAM-dependent methyltransferase [Anaerolineales bacterium]|jgi:demethylmenaquinone methyltransferase/2-methoxy-6-polyprenyl-1,4-benzoquinol methylase
MSLNKEDVRRVRRSRDSAKKTYDRMSRWYDWIAASEAKFILMGLEQLDAQQGEKVLEIGYGTGRAISPLARAVGDAGKVYGIDLSEGMHQVAQQKVRESGLAQRVDLRVGDALNLPYEDEQFDGLFMSFTLELFDTPEIPHVLAECSRVLRSSGRIEVVSLVKEGGSHLVIALYEWFHDLLPAYIDCRPIYLEGALGEGGFQIVDKRGMNMWGLPVEAVLARKPQPGDH